MTAMIRRPSLIRSPCRRACAGLALLGAAVVAAGCGDTAPNRNAQAGLEVHENGVTYLVESSRELNPAEPGDRALLAGVPRRDLGYKDDTALVGVFLEATNEGHTSHTAVAAPELVSAEGQVYKPVPLPAVDRFAYRGGRLAAGAVIPGSSTAAAEGPEQAAMLVYRVPASVVLTDRPFVVRFGNTDRAASVQLDL
jgi:hypothetical protein